MIFNQVRASELNERTGKINRSRKDLEKIDNEYYTIWVRGYFLCWWTGLPWELSWKIPTNAWKARKKRLFFSVKSQLFRLLYAAQLQPGICVCACVCVLLLLLNIVSSPYSLRARANSYNARARPCPCNLLTCSHRKCEGSFTKERKSFRFRS